MTVVSWASFTMLAGKERLALALIDAVRAQAACEQPGTLVYLVHRRVDAPDILDFYECYADDDALQAHLASSSWQAVVANWSECFVGDSAAQGVQFVSLTRIAAFARPDAIPIVPPH